MLFCVGNFSLSPELTATRGICLASKESFLWLGSSFLLDFFAAKSFIGLPVIKDQILKELLQTASMEVLDEHNIFGFPYSIKFNKGQSNQITLDLQKDGLRKTTGIPAQGHNQKRLGEGARWESRARKLKV